MSDETIESGYYARIEVMGHVSLIGYCTDVAVHGTTMLQVEVPEIPATEDRPGVPGYVRRFGGSAIYSETPIEETLARQLLAAGRPWPPHLPRPSISRQRVIVAAVDAEGEVSDPFADEGMFAGDGMEDSDDEPV